METPKSDNHLQKITFLDKLEKELGEFECTEARMGKRSAKDIAALLLIQICDEVPYSQHNVKLASVCWLGKGLYIMQRRKFFTALNR